MAGSGNTKVLGPDHSAEPQSRGELHALVLRVLQGLLVLRLSYRGNAVFEEEPRHRCPAAHATRDLSTLIGADHNRGIVIERNQLPAVVVVELLVNLGVLTTWKSHDASRLVAV